MELRNGVIHIKVNLNEIAKKNKPPISPVFSPKTEKYPQIYHKSRLSLNIPSSMSPRLVQIKENLMTQKNNSEKFNKVHAAGINTQRQDPKKIINTLICKTPRKQNKAIFPQNINCNANIGHSSEDISSTHSRKSSGRLSRPINSSKRKPMSPLINIKNS